MKIDEKIEELMQARDVLIRHNMELMLTVMVLEDELGRRCIRRGTDATPRAWKH